MPPKARVVSNKTGGASAAKTGGTAGGRQQPAVGTSKRSTPVSGPSGRSKLPVGSTAAKKAPAPAGRGGSKTTTTTAAAGKGKSTPAPKWTKQDEYARRIQRAYRGYRARKMLLELKKKKEDYDVLMEKLQREAFVHMVKLEQERAEEQQRRDQEALRRRKEYFGRIKRMLEAAFEGDMTEIKKLLKEIATLYSEAGESVVSRHQYKLVECTDANNNTPLSEAGAGGDPDTIRLLIQLGADPNVKGQYGRTPLYRAAFGGHLSAVKALLELGADPRTIADDGAYPEQVAAQAVVEDTLKAWDISVTESLLEGFEASRTKRLEKDRELKQAVEDEIRYEINEAEKAYSSKQKQLSKAHEELNKRIYEHDEFGASKGDITLPAVHDAEDLLERCKIQAEEARKKLQMVRLKLRMKRKEFQDVETGEDSGEDEEKADVVINIKELDDVLIKDVGNHIASSGKWPLIIDCGQQAATFMRYRDTNYLNVCNPRHMTAETIRMALIGAIRYGKFAVLDLLDIEDAWRAVTVKFEDVQKGLLVDLLSKELMKNDKYLTLIKPYDGEEYSAKMFGSRVDNFKLVIVTQLLSPPVEIAEQCYVIRIHTPQNMDY